MFKPHKKEEVNIYKMSTHFKLIFSSPEYSDEYAKAIFNLTDKSYFHILFLLY